MKTVADYERKLERIRTAKLPPRVEIDDLSNTIPAQQYRREQADHLATEVSRIAWSGPVLTRAKALVTAARRYARGR